MTTVRFLDGPRRGNTVQIPGQHIPAEGRYWLTSSEEFVPDGRGTPYYLKRSGPSDQSWTAAADDDFED